jgi:diguanylate cyclase (GGDEF)-like protein
MEEYHIARAFLFSTQAIVFGFLTFILWMYYRGWGRQYVHLWMLSLAALAVNYISLTAQTYAVTQGVTHPAQISYEVVEQISRYLHLTFLLLGLFSAVTKIPITRGAINWFIIGASLLGLLSSLAYAFDDISVFNRFYLRVSLSTFVIGCGFFAASFYLFVSRESHFSSRILMFFSLVLGLRYVLFSFASIVVLSHDWFRQLSQMIVYFDMAANSVLGFTLLIWMKGAERKATTSAINQVQYLGKHDSLTGVLNREQVIEKLPEIMELAITQNNKLGVFLLDITKFKFINDTYGLKAGDHILGTIAKRLNGSVLIPQVVGRLSGDSFVLVSDIHESQQVSKVVEHLHELISRPYQYNGQDIVIQCRIGYCLFPEHGGKGETLLQQANLALAQAKSQQVSSVPFETGMQSQGRHLVLMEKEIRRAIANDEFVLYFQPQLNLLTNHLEGVEALIRWQHPEKGLLTPNHFLGEVDTLGLNNELDSYVLEKACQTMDHWFNKYQRRIAIAVNLTAVEFQDPDLVPKITALLLKYAVPPSFLELEITENIVMTDIDVAMDTIIVLQTMGIKVSIDDFGTGYSSLAYLRKLPIDKIKIDRSFINEVASNDSDLTIVKSMIKLSHGLGKRVLAEGVETREQLDILRKIGCDAVQGYYISRPIPENELIKFLKRK